MRRRCFLGLPLLSTLGVTGAAPRVDAASDSGPGPASGASGIKLFLCGDVMTGRGIDQILPHPADPQLYEPYLTSALQYVRLAERANGPIPRRVDFDYIWGDALKLLADAAPDARIVNLETAVTRSDDAWPGKGINYRMHPANLPCLTAAGIDCCTLANNHVLDWGYAGLQETLTSLQHAGLHSAGAGANSAEAMAPAVIELDGDRRLIVFAMGSPSSGVGRVWAATGQKPGVWLLPELSRAGVEAVARQVDAVRRAGDIVIASIHWGSNWGHDIPREQRRFAHALIDRAGVDLVHGHSSHHARAIEVYGDRLILYGCGDFINDYEGIRGYEAFRGDLAVMYLPTLDATDGTLAEMSMQVMQLHRFRLRRAAPEDSRWLAGVLDRESRKFGTGVALDGEALRLEPCVATG
jgi:poly-gamma-glutamate synthesis protein (capsule biosynthesis protein)